MRRLTRALRGLALVAVAGAVALPAGAEQPQDAWITTKVKVALLTDDVVDGMDIDVDTFDGRVTLHGKVASDAEKSRAEQEARGIKGVQEVRNLLTVVPEAEREEMKVADDAIASKVSARLKQDKALENSDIEVKSVNNGVVVLVGDADTLSAHRRALEDARSVDGVREVASEIRSPDELGDREIWAEGEEVAASAENAASDAWITTKTKVALMAEPGLSPLAINVDTRDGEVTLFGVVGTESVKERAEARVNKVEGVKSVRNELQVVPDVAADRVEKQDEELVEAIEERLAARESLSDADISVAVENGVARLTGSVASQPDRLTALTVARGTGGVQSVIDDLTVETPES